jgi:hypothetical protein
VEKLQNRQVQNSSDKTASSSEVDPHLNSSGHNDAIIAARNQAAAPPIYLLVFVVIPFGYFLGTVSAIVAFRFYHLPLSQGAGWSWGPRSRDRSFWAGVGVGSYVGSSEKVVEQDQSATDLESGAVDRQRNNEVGAENKSTAA